MAHLVYIYFLCQLFLSVFGKYITSIATNCFNVSKFRKISSSQ